jgi:sialidase-1
MRHAIGDIIRAIISASLVPVLLHQAIVASVRAEEPQQYDVFVAGQDGYHTYRIPSCIVTSRGTVLAFCEGRKNGRGDSGDIDLLLKRSFDGGQTWEPAQVVWDDGKNTCGNPCPVIDQHTGTIWLLLTHNLGHDNEAQIVDGTSQGTRTCWVSSSSDDGHTWTNPVDITGDVKQSDWTWYATGPGVGIQTRSGRLVIPCDNKVAGTKARQSHVIYSDNHGSSWKLGGFVGPQCNESQIVELSDGRLMLNMRSYEANQMRLVATSQDGGFVWSTPREDSTLIEPVCQASFIRYSGLNAGERNILLFSNPASTNRERLTIRISYDDGTTWAASRLLHEGPAAYSCLSRLPGGQVICLYERGVKSAYEHITMARFPLEWVETGRLKSCGMPSE